jgi:ElaB/YqjD/DUF883 family membrane-anchored ribosome-binding protein
MTIKRKFVCSVLLSMFLVLQGCDKKKKAKSVPQMMEAPTVAVTLPSELPVSQEPAEQPAPAVETPPPAPPPKTKPKKPARTSNSSAKKTTPPASTPPASQPAQGNQTVASVKPPRNPADPVPSTVIAAAVPDAQVVQQKEDTSRMVDATENTLKGITRSLSDEEKSMKSQIQSYLQQSRKASTDGDYERAFNLAKKAQLLAEALVKK